MWQAYLKIEENNEKYITNYFNSLKYDLVDEPFLSFLYDFIKTFDIESENKLFSKKPIVNLIKNISRKNEIINILFSAVEAYEEGTQCSWDKIIEQENQDIIQFEKIISDFNKELSDLKENKKWVFFIDELDRARPDFALKLIEQIKHLFRMEDVFFILAVDKEQIVNIIDKQYGAGSKSSDYLNRFIDFEYQLLDVNDVNYIENLVKRYSENESIADKLFKDSERDLIDCLVSFKLNKRYPIKIINKYIIIANNIPENQLENKFFLFFLITLSISKPKLYIRIKNGDISFKELHSELMKISDLSRFFHNERGLGPLVLGLLLNIFGTDADYQTYKTKLENNDHLAERILEGYEGKYITGQNDPKGLFEFFIGKISLLDNLEVKA